MNKMFEMIIDDGTQVFKVQRIGKSPADIKKRYGGNGEFVRVQDVTEHFPISEEKVCKALEAAHFGDAEVEAIRRLLRNGYSNVIEY